MITFTPDLSLLGFPRKRVHQYGGATLLFVLIMLLLVSIIGVAAARSTLIQEKMSSNTNIRNIVFEAAESALVEGEARVANNKEIWKTIPTGQACFDGVCILSTEIEPRWAQPSFWKNNAGGEYREATKVSQKNQEGISIEIQTKYTIEDLGQTMAACDPDHIDITRSPNCPYLSSQRFFRVVGFADRQNTQAMVQSTYLDPRSTRLEPDPVDISLKVPEYVCDDGKVYVTNISTCCGPKGSQTFYPEPKCPDYCNGEEVKSGQKCCGNGPDEYIHNGDECPKFCGINQEKYFESTNMCCDDSNGVKSIMPKSVDKNGNVKCPLYCDGKEHDGSQECCFDPINRAESLQDSCQNYCGNDAIGWTPIKPGDNRCCDTPTSSTPFNYPDQNCCDDISGDPDKKKVVNGNCPLFCGTGASRRSYYPTKQQGCCSGQEVYDTTTHSCCDNKTIVNKTTHECCNYGTGVSARIGSEECCDSTQTVVNINDCPDFCPGGGTVPKKPGDSCCGPTPYIKSDTSDCCNSHELFNPQQNKCCDNASKTPVVMPGPTNGHCPEYCMGQELQSGMECCRFNNKDVAIKAIGTCPDFCWDSNSIDGAGSPAPCKYPGTENIGS